MDSSDETWEEEEEDRPVNRRFSLGQLGKRLASLAASVGEIGETLARPLAAAGELLSDSELRGQAARAVEAGASRSLHNLQRGELVHTWP